MIFALIIIVDYQYLSSYNNEFFYKDSYYETDEFQQNYVRLSHNVVEKHLDLIDEETINESRVDNDKTVSLSRLNAIEDNLRRSPSFIYVLLNTKSGETITNIDSQTHKSNGFSNDEEYISSFETVIQWDSLGLYFPVKSVMEKQPLVYRHYNTISEYSTTNVTASDVVYRLRSDEWIYYTAVDFNLMDSDILFGSGYYDFQEYKEETNNQFPVLVVSIFTLFFIIIYLSMVIGKQHIDDKVKLFFYDYIPLEIQFILAIIAFIPLVTYQSSSYLITDVNSLRVQLATASLAFVIVVSAMLLSLVRLIKTKYIYRNPITFKIWWWIRSLFILDFINPLTKVKIIGILSVYITGSILMTVFGMITNNNYLKIIVLIIFISIQVTLGIYLLVIIKDLTTLIKATKKRALGEADYPINEESYKTTFKSFAKDLNSLQNGLQVALDDAIRGEKLKTELITNVSHDLKNPLTSIITYIDLLEKSLILYYSASLEEKQELKSNMKDYIRILNNKGYRLKTLIEDLVSASKASSGNLDVELMNINIRQLLVQIIVDREEYFDRLNLEVIITPEIATPVWSLVDPNHMYRVFENIISNILKYTLVGTRVFIDAYKVDNEVIITFKNISNHPLNDKNIDLAGRFVRGDESRTTEGSGLGLSIVESLLKLQNGNQEIIIDGDMFKVIIHVPKGEETNGDGSY